MVPIHNHTQYSALDGLATCEEIAERVAELNFHSCGITDHDLVAGHYDFYQTLTDKGIKPLLGVETYQSPVNRRTNYGFRNDPQSKEKADNFHLILVAMNDTGLRNLWAMNTEAHATGFYYNGRVDWELLKKYNEGIICTSACALSMLSQSIKGNFRLESPERILNRYLDIFGDRFYIELGTYGSDFQRQANEGLVSLAREKSVPLVYANDAHYANPNQYTLHETVLCMQYREKLKDRTEPHHVPDLYIMDEKEVEKQLGYLDWADIDAAIEGSEEISNRCDVKFPGRRKRTPVFVPESRWSTTKDMFFDILREGYDKKVVGKVKDEKPYLERLEHEVKVITKADLIEYMMVSYDLVESSRKQGILVGPGRGSVGGSLVAFLLGITQVDPIRYGLIFERFYNVGREGSLPDIDIDFPKNRRDRVKALLAKKYGKEYVSELGTALTIHGKAGIRKLSVTRSIPKPDTDAICKMIDKAVDAGLQPDWDSIKKVGGADLQKLIDKHPFLFRDAEELHKRIFSYGVHASGVIVSDEPLGTSFPLRWVANDKKLVTQWDMRVADKLGFMKNDVLAVRNLDTLQEVNNLLRGQGKKAIDWWSLQYHSHPNEMWEQLDRGRTVGIFQVEDGKQAKELANQIKPRSVEDLALLVAVNRPGPLRQVLGEKELYALQPFKDILSETGNRMVYQEQIIAMFTRLGYSPEEADHIRNIMGKKKTAEMQKEHERFMQYAFNFYEKTDVGGGKESLYLTEALWGNVTNFAKYAFNKSHSVAYGIIALATLYAKHHYPREFILASMRTADKNERYRYVEEAKRMGIEFFSVDLNESEEETSLAENGIRYGFADVKNVGKGPAKWLVKNRPFKDWDDVLVKAQESERKITLPNGTRMVGIKAPQVQILRDLSEKSGNELLDLEEELLGVAISDKSARILEDYSKEIDTECTPLYEAIEPGIYTIAGVVKAIKKTKTKQGKEMAWVTIESGGDTRDIAVWSDELKKLSFVWRNRQAVVANVRVNDRGTSLINAKPLFAKTGD
jgi:DNA polymerase-3 subunit alpha